MGQTLGALVKLGICGLSIVAIAWAILILDGSGDVKSGSADILSLNPVPLSNTAKLENALKSLGHSEPRTYDFNGNEVAFSSRTTRKPQMRIIEEYQRAFVRQGLNEEVYMPVDRSGDPDAETREALQKRREAMMSGQIVPIEVHPNYAVMGAGMVEGQPATRAALETHLRHNDWENYESMFDGYRFIETFRDPESGSTSVTASWSRGSFDVKKHMPKRYPQRQVASPRSPVPRCLGCTRVMGFDGRANASPDELGVYGTKRDPDRVARFYDDAMHRRGWRRTDTSLLLNRVLDRAEDVRPGAAFRQYSRGESQITMSIRKTPGLDKTTVTTYQSN